MRQDATSVKITVMKKKTPLRAETITTANLGQLTSNIIYLNIIFF